LLRTHDLDHSSYITDTKLPHKGAEAPVAHFFELVRLNLLDRCL
jgi:hypothetical protein